MPEWTSVADTYLHPSAPPVLSVSPLTLTVPGRPLDLEVRVSAPLTGTDLPVILLSHGHGGAYGLSSLDGYLPLAKVWAARGFVVIQPNHLSAPRLSHQVAEVPGAPLFWRSRAEDMSHIIDRLDEIEQAVPQLAGRIDRGKVAVAGHSLGGFTAELLLGARITDPDTDEEVDLLDPRITQGVLIGATGRGGDTFNGFAADRVPVFRTMNLTTMTTPALVIAGDKDDSQHWTTMGPDWHADPYHLAPGPKTLLTVFNGEHLFGGIQGHDSVETTDESPDRVAAVAELAATYLRTAFDSDATAWRTAQDALTTGPDAFGRVESKEDHDTHHVQHIRKAGHMTHRQHPIGSGFTAASTADDVLAGTEAG
ncbi:alpha/beta hydrolase family protein [Streptomyces sp. NBC_01708]|uniref:alpha/beta hydrolase family protein n=1 Tax=Streptomyces sp. NBC_01708 TaxID=2975915 RepID=UPI002E3048DC|nr:chlorophyllase [Streptomyces sp. NBC_01708]